MKRSMLKKHVSVWFERGYGGKNVSMQRLKEEAAMGERKSNIHIVCFMMYMSPCDRTSVWLQRAINKCIHLQ